MKLHLPIVLFAAVVSAASYADTVECPVEPPAQHATTAKGYTGTYVKDTSTGETLSGKVTVTATGGVFTYETIKDDTTVNYEDGTIHQLKSGTVKSEFTGDIGTAVLGGLASRSTGSKGAKPGTVSAMPTEYVNSEGRAHTAQHTYMIIGDGVTETKVTCVIGGGIPGDRVIGDKTIVVENNATVDYVVGGAYFNTSYVQPGYDGPFPSCLEASTTDSTITIQVKNGGKVLEIYGSNWVRGNAATYGEDGETKFVGNEKVVIDVAGEEAEVGSIIGAYYSSVNNSVNITIRDGAHVTGNVRGGSAGYSAKNSSYVKSSNIVIKGEGTRVDGNVYGGGAESSEGMTGDIKDSTYIEIAGGSVGGNVYGGGKGGTVGNGKEGDGSRVVLAGGVVEGNLYAAGIGDTINGDAVVELLDGKVNGGVYGGGVDDKSNITGNKILYIGSDTQTFTGSVGSIEGFTEIIVGNGSRVEMTADDSNIFGINEHVITMSEENLREASLIGSSARIGERGLKLTLLSEGGLSSGRYMIARLTDSDSAPLGWTEENVEFECDFASIDDTVWEGNILYLIYKQWNVDAAIVSNWGVFKSSQAFTGTLWGNRSNAVVLNAPAVAPVTVPNDGKAPVASAEQPTPAAHAATLAWASAYGQSGRISNAGADYSLYGAAMGIERQFGATGSSIGVAFGYDWGKVNPFTTTSADQETWHAALYGRVGAWKAGKGIVSVDWSAAYGDTTTEHNDFASDWSQESWQLDLRATYARALSERATASVFAGVQYYTHDDATVDNMHISSVQNLRLTAGAGLSYAATARTNVYGQASVYFDAMRHNPHVDTNGACFKGTNPGRIGGVFSVGADYAITDRWTLRGAYSFDVAKDSTEHNVNAGVQYSF